MSISELDVSRETLDMLSAYHDLLLKWSPKINLVSKSGLNDLWDRHIWDSVQIFPIARDFNKWVDIGSGGGLPGLIIAILSREYSPASNILLIESDMRKSAFLRTVIRELELKASVIVSRIEVADSVQADVLSARALANLSTLLPFAQRHLKQDGQALFSKGETWEKEVMEARKSWSFDLVPHTSKTNPNAAILEVREIQRVRPVTP